MKKTTQFLTITIILSMLFYLFTPLAVPIVADAELGQHQITHSIVISNDEEPLPPTAVGISEGDTVLDALIRATDEHGIDMAFRGNGASAYVEGIDDVYEFDRGSGSGWMYRVNGIFPNRGAGVVPLIPGDRVEWLYTTDLGNDLGADLAPFRDQINPTITVDGVKDGTTVNKPDISFTVTAKSYFGTLLTPTVKVNEETLSTKDGVYIVTLNEGESEITIEAADQAGRTIQKSLIVTYEKKEVEESKQEQVKDHATAIATSINDVSDLMIKNGVTSEWEAIGLAKAGKEVPASYMESFQEHLQDQVLKRTGSGRMKITDVERLTIAATALGLDPTNIDGEGFNLIEKIYESEHWTNGEDSMTFQGNNGIIFALIALDTKDFPVPNEAKWTRDKLIQELLKYQRSDGAWSLSTDANGPSSYDITAMALIGLAPYAEQAKVKEAIDKAVDFLSTEQGPTGGYNEAFVGGISSEATSQVVIGLTANGIDPQSEAFTKNGINLIDHLLSFKAGDGGFKHTVDDQTSNPMATEQALQALVAYDLFVKGEGPLYQFKDIEGNKELKPISAPEKESELDERKSGLDEKKEPTSTIETNSTNDESPNDDPDDPNRAGNVQIQEGSNTGLTGKLPRTATEMFNFLLIGTLLVTIGGVTRVYRRKDEV